MNYYNVLAKKGKSGPIEILAALADDESGAKAHVAQWAPEYNIQEVKLIAEGEKPCPTDASSKDAAKNPSTDATATSAESLSIDSGAPPTDTGV